MEEPSTNTRSVFLARLRESGLITDDQLLQFDDSTATTESGRDCARSLVEQGMLTRFQAEMLLAGRTDGFTLGQYRILEQVGRGGTGRVFKAEHQTMKRIVALKVLANEFSRSERTRQLFQREVRAAARLIHPHIVTAYDANQSGDRHYLVMEYVDGPNLNELVKQHGPLAIGQACDLIRQAALGLQFAHEMGMVHRDIKPANLLLQQTHHASVVKILDFGLARLHQPARSDENAAGRDSIPAAEQAVMGTPDYLSPEQAKNLHCVDIRSDLYSLGCTFFYLLTGQPPFAKGTSLEKIVRHATEPAPLVHTLRPEVPLGVSAIIAKLMAKDPAQRFQSPRELADALVSFANAGALPSFTPSAGSKLTGDSPWADIFDDDERANASTLPGNLGLTPVPTKSTPRPSRADLPSRRILWYVVIAIVLSLLTGFALGTLVFALK